MRAACGLLALLPVFSLTCYRVLEIKEARYSSYSEAERAGEFKRGWIPRNVVPRSAVGIISRHDIDTNEIWVRFSFSNVDEMRQVVRDLPALQSQDAAALRVRDANAISWWPKVVGGAEADPEGEGYEVLRVPGRRGGYLAVQWEERKAYYWE